MEGDRGGGGLGRSLRGKWQEAGEGRAGSGIPKVVGIGRKQVKFGNILLNYANRYETKVREWLWKGAGGRLKNTGCGRNRDGRREVQTPLSPTTKLSFGRKKKEKPRAGFRSIKRLGIFLLPPEWDASPVQGSPSALCRRYPFIHLGGERHSQSKVSCQRTQH